MATNRKYQNISIQPPKLPRTSKTIYELPRENLTESDLVKKSTSDRTKRRVAHEAWFPRPVITKPIMPVVAQRKPKKKHILKKGLFSRVKPCKLRQINETVALNSARAQHSQSTSSGVDDRLKADKRKLGDLDCDEVIKKKQKKGNVDKSINKNVKQEKKSPPSKGVDDKVKADKSNLGKLDCDEVPKKGNVDKSKNKDLKQEKKSHSCKGVDERVNANKRKLGDLDCDEGTKKKQKKNNVDKAINKDVKGGKKSHPRKGKADFKNKKKHIQN